MHHLRCVLSLPSHICTLCVKVLYDICRSLLPIFEPRPCEGKSLSQCESAIEIFLARLRQLHCGSMDASAKTRVVHPQRDKILIVSGLDRQMDLLASMVLLVDVWEGCYSRFYAFFGFGCVLL